MYIHEYIMIKPSYKSLNNTFRLYRQNNWIKCISHKTDIIYNVPTETITWFEHENFGKAKLSKLQKKNNQNLDDFNGVQ